MRDTLLYATGPVFNKIIAFFLIPFYSYILIEHELGYYDLILTSSQLIVAVGTLKISDSLYRWLMDNNIDDDLRTSAISNSFAVIMASILLMLVINYAIPAGSGPMHKNLICLLIITVLLLGHLFQLLRGLKLIKEYAYVSIFNGILLLCSNIILLGIFHLRLQGVMLSLVISNSICILYISYRIHLLSFLKINMVNSVVLKSMIKYSAPLVYNAISWWLMGGFDRYVIAGFLGLDANGIYAIAAKFSAVIILINSFFLPAWQDMLLKESNLFSVKMQFSKMLNLYITLLLSLVILLSSLSKIFIEHAIDPRYYEAWKYIPVLLAGNALLALTSFIGTLYVLERNTYHIFITSVLGSVVNILISVLLINSVQLYGPGLGMLSGFLAIFLVRYFYYKKRISIQIQLRPLLLLFTIFIFVMWCLYFANRSFYYVSIFIAITTFLLVNRKLGLELFRTISNTLLRSKTGNT